MKYRLELNADVGSWMDSNILKLIFHIKTFHVKVASSYIKSSTFIRNLGSGLDNTLRMEKQVHSI